MWGVPQLIKQRGVGACPSIICFWLLCRLKPTFFHTASGSMDDNDAEFAWDDDDVALGAALAATLSRPVASALKSEPSADTASCLSSGVPNVN